MQRTDRYCSRLPISVRDVDISMFIRNLPNGKETDVFCTEDASGSTSQAANVVEAMETGSERSEERRVGKECRL